MYPKTSVHRVAAPGVPAKEMSFSVTEDSGYQVATARVQDPEFLSNEIVTKKKTLKAENKYTPNK